MVNTITDTLVLCDVEYDMNNLIWNEFTLAERIADEIFDKNFNSFIDITFKELAKTNAELISALRKITYLTQTVAALQGKVPQSPADINKHYC